MATRFWDWQNPGADLYLRYYNTFSSRLLLYSVVTPASLNIILLINTYWYFFFFFHQLHNLCPVWMFFSNMEVFNYLELLNL